MSESLHKLNEYVYKKYAKKNKISSYKKEDFYREKKI